MIDCPVAPPDLVPEQFDTPEQYEAAVEQRRRAEIEARQQRASGQRALDQARAQQDAIGQRYAELVGRDKMLGVLDPFVAVERLTGTFRRVDVITETGRVLTDTGADQQPTDPVELQKVRLKYCVAKARQCVEYLRWLPRQGTSSDLGGPGLTVFTEPLAAPAAVIAKGVAVCRLARCFTIGLRTAGQPQERAERELDALRNDLKAEKRKLDEWARLEQARLDELVRQ